MLSMLSAVFGFAAPFLPQLVQYFQRKQDNAHEIEMMKLRLEHAAAEHTWKMEEINAQADIAEMQTLRQPQQSFGVQLLDAAQKWATDTWGKFLVMPAFYAFAFLDFVSGMVRPTVTYGVVIFYMATKWALYRLAVDAGTDVPTAITQIWGEQDWSVLVLVLSYWFGARVAKSAFGGSASTGKAGGG